MGYQNILLIDDDDDDQEIFLLAVAQVSKAVTCIALSGAVDALQKLASNEINPEIIFLDLNMPVIDGLQFLIKMKQIKRLKNIPVIIFSTSAHPATIQHSKELGASGYITKPDNFNDLAGLLTPLLCL
ncbi:MAG: response regulator [Puia sp.]